MTDLTIDSAFLLRCAQELVRAESENPPGDETRVAAVAASFCEQAGCSVTIDDAGGSRRNVIATLGAGAPGRTLLWNGHLDVVPAGDHALWDRPPYDGELVDGMLHGRGSADMKGGIAAAIAAAKALRDAGLPSAGRFVLHLVADEEVLGPHGTRSLYERGLVQADAAIIGEPTGLDVAIAERGLLWVRARFRGVAAHGSQPDKGKSAIEAASRAVLALRSMRFEASHALLGGPTLNVGVIRGGDKTNIVPPWAEIEIDRRTVPGETREQILAEIAAAIAGDDATLDVFLSAEPCEVSPGEEIVRLALEAYRAVRGRDGSTGAMEATTDAHCIVGQAGIPAIVFGPGLLAKAHTANERAPLAEIEDAARMYALIARTFLS